MGRRPTQVLTLAAIVAGAASPLGCRAPALDAPTTRPIEDVSPARSVERGPSVGLISDFDHGQMSAAFGTGWHPSTDAVLGGLSSSALEVVSSGADGTPGALRVSGLVERRNHDNQWGGAIFMPGAPEATSADLSGALGISFFARGDGRNYTVGVFTVRDGERPRTKSFRARADWDQHRVLFGELPVNPREVVAIAFVTDEPGRFDMRLDQVELTQGDPVSHPGSEATESLSP